MPWIIAGGAVVGGLLGADAAGKASDAQGKAAGQSIAEQRRQFDLTRADNAPFLATGTAANKRLARLLGIGDTGGSVNFKGQTYDNLDALKGGLVNDYVNQGGDPSNPAYKSSLDSVLSQATPMGAPSGDYGSLLKKFSIEDRNADPVYQSGLQFGADQGRDAINARATSSGMYDSGATLKALTRFGNDYGSTKANESYNRFTNDQNNIFNRLSGVSGTGQVATGQVASAGTSMANNVSNDITGAGNARAAGIVGGANAWGNAFTGIGNAANNYQSNQRLNALLARGGNRYASYGGQNLSQDDYSGGFY